MPEPARTVHRRFADAARNYPNSPALSSKVDKSWVTLTYLEAQEKANQFSAGLRTLGFGRGDRMAIISENRTEWTLCDLGALAAGGVTVPIYPTLPQAQITPLLADCGAAVVVVSDSKQLQKVIERRSDLPKLQAVVVMDLAAASDGTLTFADVMKHGMDSKFISENIEVGGDDLMSIIYTSGTTGDPKGVMLTHASMCATIDSVLQDYSQFHPPSERLLSFLPLCHVFERVVSCLSLSTGGHTYYNDSIFKLIDNMTEAKPTIMTNVPRVFESIHERILGEVAKQPPKKQAWFRWALEVGEHCAARSNAGKSLGPFWPLQRAAADKIVLSKIRNKFGGAIKFFVSGGAPLNPHTGAFFQALGIPILEGWGLTETTGPATVSPYGRAKLGTVGRAASLCEVCTADDGELLVRGANVMRGYWNKPDATADAIDTDGWFHSGDIGEIDSNGYITITDRKKDLIVLANGKKVAPQPIETKLKRSPYIADIVLLGDNTGSITALVLPNFERIKEWRKMEGKESAVGEALAADPAVKRLFKSEIEAGSKDLADFEKIRKFALLHAPLTIENGELTPTLKVKRRVVAEKYGSLLERDDRSA